MFKVLFFLFIALSNPLFSISDFMVVTPQKTGTHLLTKAMALLTDRQALCYPGMWIEKVEFEKLLDQAKRENKYVHMHAFPQKHLIETLKARGTKVIFLMRDPRDVCISLLFYTKNHGFYYGPINQKGPFGNLSFQEQLDEIITGRRWGLSVPVHFIGKRLPWMNLDPSFCHTAYFEKLVGEKGGGSIIAQKDAINALLNHIELKLEPKQIKKRIKYLYGRPGETTFRSGKIGEWKLYFTEEDSANFKQVFGDELIRLGYETNHNW